MDRSLGLRIGSGCDARVQLLPRVRYAGAWHGGGLDGACTVAAGKAICPAGAAGQVELTLDGAVVKTRFSAAKDTIVEGLAAEGPATLTGATTWMSNGFQSWSQSGALAIGPAPGDQELSDALAARGGGEVLRSGKELSWTFTVAGGGGGGGPYLLAGALAAARFKPWVQVWRDAAGDLHLRIASGGRADLPARGRRAGAREPAVRRLVARRRRHRREAVRPVLAVHRQRSPQRGGALFLSDDLTKLDASRKGWGLDGRRVGLAIGGAPAVPVDYLPAGAPTQLQTAIGDQLTPTQSSSNVVPELWQLPDGSRVGLNVTDSAVTVGGKTVSALGGSFLAALQPRARQPEGLPARRRFTPGLDPPQPTAY